MAARPGVAEAGQERQPRRVGDGGPAGPARRPTHGHPGPAGLRRRARAPSWSCRCRPRRVSRTSRPLPSIAPRERRRPGGGDRGPRWCSVAATTSQTVVAVWRRQPRSGALRAHDEWPRPRPGGSHDHHHRPHPTDDPTTGRPTPIDRGRHRRLRRADRHEPPSAPSRWSPSSSACASASTPPWPRARPRRPSSPRRAGIDARYAREWFEQQATAGLVGRRRRRRRRRPRQPRVLAARRAPGLPARPRQPGLRGAAGHVRAWPGPFVLDELVDAYRAGTGISFGGYGPWIRQPRAAQPAASSPTCSRRTGSRPCPTWSLAWRPPVPRGRHRLRLRLVVDRPRPRLPRDDRRRLRQRRGVRSPTPAPTPTAAGVADRVRFTVARRGRRRRRAPTTSSAASRRSTTWPTPSRPWPRCARMAGARTAPCFVIDERAADALTRRPRPDAAPLLRRQRPPLPARRAQRGGLGRHRHRACAPPPSSATRPPPASPPSRSSPSTTTCFRFYRLHP